MYDAAALIDLIQTRALKFGDFTLVSGQKSSYYLDGKQITLNSVGLSLVSHGLLELVKDLEFDAIGGMSIGADPIIGGVLTAAVASGRDLDGFMCRKEAKGHGTNRYIEGPVTAGDKVIVIDDVITTGGSTLMAIDRAEEFGLEVVQAVGIIDRLQGGAQAFQERGIPFGSLLTITDLGVEPPAIA